MLEFLLILNVFVLIIGGVVMNELNQAVTALNAAIASLEARLGNGVIVNSADLAAAAASINSAAQTLDTLAV